MELTEHQYRFDNTFISYSEGPDNGPTLVLLHGLTGYRQSFQPILPAFTPTWHVYACDLLGHGQSGRTTSYRVMDHVRAIVTFLRGQIAQPTVVIGHSLGGLTALGVGAEAPEQTRALVLLDPPLHLRRTSIVEASPYNLFQWVHQTMLPGPTYDEVLAATRQFMPQLNEVELHAMAERIYGIDPESVGVFLRDEGVEGYDFEQLLQRVTAPTLILRADPRLEPAMDDADAAFAEANLRHGQVLVVPNAGHRVHVDQTDLVIHQIQTFLATV